MAKHGDRLFQAPKTSEENRVKEVVEATERLWQIKPPRDPWPGFNM